MNPMKRALFLFLFGGIIFNVLAQNSALKDFREVYLWDVTLSMKGCNDAPNIYDKVVDALVNSINSISNERTEIVVIPFQDTEYCEVWREQATQSGKEYLIKKITSYNNDKKTNTNISAPLQYVIKNILSKDKIDILKLLTDGRDNVDPVRLREILNRWCDLAREKDVFGYYILLTKDAKSEKDLILKLKEICNFEVIDLENNIEGLGNIVQVNAPFATNGLVINVRDEYNIPKRIQFSSYGGNMPDGYKIHFNIEENPYVELNEVCTMLSDNTFELHPKFKKPLDELKNILPPLLTDLYMSFTPADGMNLSNYSLTRLLNDGCPVKLVNKPEKSVRIYIK